jgi:hypothetical protein
LLAAHRDIGEWLQYGKAVSKLETTIFPTENGLARSEFVRQMIAEALAQRPPLGQTRGEG